MCSNTTEDVEQGSGGTCLFSWAGGALLRDLVNYLFWDDSVSGLLSTKCGLSPIGPSQETNVHLGSCTQTSENSLL